MSVPTKTKSSLNHRRLDKTKNELSGWMFVSPFVFGFLAYFAIIVFKSLQFSFSQIDPGDGGYNAIWNHFQNYNYALRVDPNFIQNLFYTIVQMLTDIPVIILFSLFIAVVLNQKMHGRTFFRAIFFIPVVIATGLVPMVDTNNAVLITMSSLAPIKTGSELTGGGLLTFANMQLYLQQLDFSPTIVNYVVGAIDNIISIVDHSGVQIIIFLAGLQSISPSVYESAMIEGASAWETFWKITLPLISPLILVNLFYSIISFLTSDDNLVMNQIKITGFGNAMFGPASAMAWIYFLVIGIIVVIAGFIINKLVFYQDSAR